MTSPAPREAWASVVRSDPNAVVSQSLAWRDALVASGEYRDVSLLYEFPSGRRVVLPLAQRRVLPGGLASWPGDWGVGGPICEGGAVRADEAAHILADVARRRTLAVEIQLSHAADALWLSQARHFRVHPAACYVLDLAGGFGEVWQRKFRGTARTAVRKAERSGLEIDVDSSGGLLADFFALYEKSIQRWAAMEGEPSWLTRRRMTRAASPAMLSLVAGHLGDACTTWVARREGEAVAAIIVLRWGAHAKYWRGAMDKEAAGPVRANNLLHRLAIEQACLEGCRLYDMGYSPPGSAISAFKETFGAALRHTHSLRAERLPLADAERVARTAVNRAARLPRLALGRSGRPSRSGR